MDFGIWFDIGKGFDCDIGVEFCISFYDCGGMDVCSYVDFFFGVIWCWIQVIFCKY